LGIRKKQTFESEIIKAAVKDLRNGLKRKEENHPDGYLGFNIDMAVRNYKKAITKALRNKTRARRGGKKAADMTRAKK
jgi:hypothetical protein